jgi:hypothetical protein
LTTLDHCTVCFGVGCGEAHATVVARLAVAATAETARAAWPNTCTYIGTP